MSIWKIIIAVCLGTVGAVILLELFIPADPDQPTLPDELLLQSQAMRIELEGETGSGWSAAIAAANKGSSADLDSKIDQALFHDRYDAALAAIGLLQNGKLASSLYGRVAGQAVEDCQSLPYAAFAVDGMQDGKPKSQLSERVHLRWNYCKKRK